MNAQKRLVRSAMFYEFKLGHSAAECFRNICKAFGEEAVTERTCQRWFHRFRSGDESLEDEEREGRPSLVDEEALKECIEADPRQSLRELATRFGCTHVTIASHLHSIGKTVRHGKWVPHELTENNLCQRLLICSSLLSRAKRIDFFDSIVTSDEKWIQYDNPHRKLQWLEKGEPPVTTPKADAHGKKVLLCVWWNSRGLVHFELLDPGQTVTADLYIQQLSHVDQALRRQGVDTTTTKLLHDNARPHTAKITQQKIEEFGWEVLPYAPYSPDLAPSDYHLFRSMQHALEEKKFKNREEVQIWVSGYFESKPAEFFANGIQSLRGRWRKVIDNNGNYLVD